MLIKVEITKTYWIGIDAQQKDDLVAGILIAISNQDIIGGPAEHFEKFSFEQQEALNAFRLALLNA